MPFGDTYPVRCLSCVLLWHADEVIVDRSAINTRILSRNLRSGDHMTQGSVAAFMPLHTSNISIQAVPVGINPRPSHISIQGFIEDELGHQIYTDDHIVATGWCVYNLHEGLHLDPEDPCWTGEVDTSEEDFFASIMEARYEARVRSIMYGVCVREY